MTTNLECINHVNSFIDRHIDFVDNKIHVKEKEKSSIPIEVNLDEEKLRHIRLAQEFINEKIRKSDCPKEITDKVVKEFEKISVWVVWSLYLKNNDGKDVADFISKDVIVSFKNNSIFERFKLRIKNTLVDGEERSLYKIFMKATEQSKDNDIDDLANKLSSKNVMEAGKMRMQTSAEKTLKAIAAIFKNEILQVVVFFSLSIYLLKKSNDWQDYLAHTYPNFVMVVIAVMSIYAIVMLFSIKFSPNLAKNMVEIVSSINRTKIINAIAQLFSRVVFNAVGNQSEKAAKNLKAIQIEGIFQVWIDATRAERRAIALRKNQLA
ncbi:MAG: hypothetical protein L0207_05210 [Chlamydiae bacterium]|nr:hypothetical protein [Chlamydiota bacterium]